MDEWYLIQLMEQPSPQQLEPCQPVRKNGWYGVPMHQKHRPSPYELDIYTDAELSAYAAKLQQEELYD